MPLRAPLGQTVPGGYRSRRKTTVPTTHDGSDAAYEMGCEIGLLCTMVVKHTRLSVELARLSA